MAGGVLRVGVTGAFGRMGSAVRAAVAADPGCELVAAIDPRAPASVPGGTPAFERLEGLLAGGATDPGLDVVVDFSVAEAALETARFCAAHGVHLVSGTTGHDAEALEELARLFGAPGGANCVLAANFAISAVLMNRFAELAAPHFDSIEIIELHHDDKRDAPSGTALETARLIAESRRSACAGALRPDPTEDEKLAGARGGAGPDGIRLHSVRLHGLIAHQEVLLGTTGQTLTIRQDSYDRSSFMPGVLLALHRVATTPGLTLGLAPLLGL